MKKILASLTLSLILFGALLTGCSPALTAATGNGNLLKNSEVLKYDDYIYFAGEFRSNTKINKGENRNADLDALYRIKLEDGEISFDEDGNAKNVEKVLGKIVGTEHAFLHSVGDKIIFASPSTGTTKKGETLFERSTYFIANNNGTALKELLTTEGEVVAQSLLTINGKSYVISYDGSNIYKIDIQNASAKILATDVTGVAFATSYESEFDKNIFYTTARPKSDTDLDITGNILNKVNFETEVKEEEIRKIVGETITLHSVSCGYLFYTRTDDIGDTLFFANNFNSSFSNGEIELAGSNASDLTSITIMGKDKDGDMLPIVYNYQSKLCYRNFGSKVDNEILAEGVTILFTNGDYVYYSKSSGIYRISYKNKVEQQISDLSDFKTNISFDGEYIYFFAKNPDNTTGKFYMYRASVVAAENGTGIKTQLLSKLDKADIKTDEE